jgi:hypothetical protein
MQLRAEIEAVNANHQIEEEEEEDIIPIGATRLSQQEA